MTDVKEKIETLKLCRLDIVEATILIQERRRQIKELEKQIWRECNHEWIVNNDLMMYDNCCKQLCLKCGLYKNSYLYN